MKKFSLVALIVAVLAFTLVGCSSGNNAAATNDEMNNQAETTQEADTNDAEAEEVTQEEMDAAVQEIKDKGKLVLATSADYPPYEWHLLDDDGEDKIVGFDIEIAQALADSIGVELEIKDLDFEAIIPSIASGQADIGIAGLSKTPERLNAVNMTDPYFTNEQVVIVPKEDADKYKTMEDFAEKTVGAQTGSLQEATVQENFPDDVELKSLPKLNNLVLEVKNGTADALVISKSAGEQYVKQFPELVVIDPGVPEEPGVCIAVKKGNDALTAYMNQELKKLMDEGKVEAWIAEYEELSSEALSEEMSDDATGNDANDAKGNNDANDATGNNDANDKDNANNA